MQIVKLILWILICQVPGLIGMGAVNHGMEWYNGLNQPSFTPPNWLFGAAWSVLYILLGVAGWMLTRGGINRQNRMAVILFVAQLIVNACWTPVFFGQKAIGWALVILTLLVLLTLWLMQQCWRLRNDGLLLLVPYILWLFFAWGLNYAVLILN